MWEILTTLRRTRGVPLLLLGSFLITFGGNLVLPYLAIYLTRDRNMAPWVVGLAFTAKLWAQQGLMIVGGRLSDRRGSVQTICLGLGARLVAYLCFSLFVTPASIVFACGLLGLGNALYIPASKSALADLARDHFPITRVFALRSAANNTGTALGPLAGGLLLLVSPRAVFVVAGALFLVITPWFWMLRPVVAAVATPRFPEVDGHPPRGGVVRLLRYSPRLRWALLTAVGFGYCYVQIEYALPTMVATHHDAALVGVLFSVNAVSVVVLQLLVTGRLTRIRSTPVVLAGGLTTMAVGFAAMSQDSVAALVAGVVLFSLGEVVVDPRLDGEVAAVTARHDTGTAFGLVGVSIALGGALANWGASGTLGPAHAGSLYWFLPLGVALGVAAVTWLSAPPLPQPDAIEARAQPSTST